MKLNSTNNKQAVYVSYSKKFSFLLVFLVDLKLLFHGCKISNDMDIFLIFRWKEVLSAKSSDNQNRMGKLIQRFPTAAASVMDRCIQRSLPQRSITYDFRLLDPGPDDQSGLNAEPFFGLMFMVKHKQTDLLVHDLSRKLLKIKWRSYGWFVYWTNLALFSLFLTFMTYFMLTQRKLVTLKPQNNADSDDDNDDDFMQKDAFHNATGFLILIFASFHLVKEIYQIFTQRMGYFKQWTNALEWVLYLSTIMFVIPYVFPSASKLRGDPRISWQMGTVAVFLGYINLILFVQTLNYVGIYVTMFFRVATTVLKTIGLFTLFAVAFSVVFYILFREQVGHYILKLFTAIGRTQKRMNGENVSQNFEERLFIITS